MQSSPVLTAPAPVQPAAPDVPPQEPGALEQEPDEPRPVRAALSPSRAADFLQCPLLYRFRVVDRLAEAPSPAAVRGTAGDVQR
jgi:putative RecB family exonuclease